MAGTQATVDTAHAIDGLMAVARACGRLMVLEESLGRRRAWDSQAKVDHGTALRALEEVMAANRALHASLGIELEVALIRAAAEGVQDDPREP